MARWKMYITTFFSSVSFQIDDNDDLWKRRKREFNCVACTLIKADYLCFVASTAEINESLGDLDKSETLHVVGDLFWILFSFHFIFEYSDEQWRPHSQPFQADWNGAALTAFGVEKEQQPNHLWWPTIISWGISSIFFLNF